MEHQGWLLGAFAVGTAGPVCIRCEVRILFVSYCKGVAAVFVDDVPVAADLYGRKFFEATMDLARGVHLLRVRVRSKVADIISVGR